MLKKRETLADFEDRMILLTLEQHQGNRTHTAHALGVCKRTLTNKINSLKARKIKHWCLERQKHARKPV